MKNEIKQSEKECSNCKYWYQGSNECRILTDFIDMHGDYDDIPEVITPKDFYCKYWKKKS